MDNPTFIAGQIVRSKVNVYTDGECHYAGVYFLILRVYHNGLLDVCPRFGGNRVMVNSFDVIADECPFAKVRPGAQIPSYLREKLGG